MKKKKSKAPRKKSLKTLRKAAWDACSKYVRNLYADESGYVKCYTCDPDVDGTPWKRLPIKEIQAGHAIDGRHNAVLFDLDIIRPQCFQCNSKMGGCKSGNHKVFTYKLIREFGPDWWHDKLMSSHRTVKMSRTDYEKLEQDFLLKTQQLSIDRRTAKWNKP